MKRIICLFTALVLCLAFVLPAFADEGDFIIDDAEYIQDYEQFDKLEGRAREVFLKTKMVACFATDDQEFEGEISDAAKAFYENKVTFTDGVFLYVNSAMHQIYIFAEGPANDSFTDDDYSALIDAYNDAETVYDGVIAYLDKAETLLAEADSDSMLRLIPFIDSEKLVSSEDNDQILNKFFQLSETHQFEIVGVTKAECSDNAAREAADYFENNNYGYGDTRDGIILIVSEASRNVGLAALGSGVEKFPDDILDYIRETITPSLSDGKYAEAFNTYADMVDQELTTPGTLKAAAEKAAEEKAAEEAARKKAEQPLRIIVAAVFGLLVGFLLSMIPVSAMKRKLNSVAMQSGASLYTVPNSMILTNQRDIYLYRTVTRTKRVKETTSSSGRSGGGGTSSSGRSYSGSSGKF